jgi:hypothetical protein
MTGSDASRFAVRVNKIEDPQRGCVSPWQWARFQRRATAACSIYSAATSSVPHNALRIVIGALPNESRLEATGTVISPACLVWATPDSCSVKEWIRSQKGRVTGFTHRAGGRIVVNCLKARFFSLHLSFIVLTARKELYSASLIRVCLRGFAVEFLSCRESRQTRRRSARADPGNAPSNFRDSRSGPL